MDAKTNADLVIHYLNLLKARKEAALAAYQPTIWETFTREEQLQLSDIRCRIEEREDLDAQIYINKVLRSHKEDKRLRREAYCP